MLFKASLPAWFRFWLGCSPDPAGGAYSTPPDPLGGFEGHNGCFFSVERRWCRQYPENDLLPQQWICVQVFSILQHEALPGTTGLCSVWSTQGSSDSDLVQVMGELVIIIFMIIVMVHFEEVWHPTWYYRPFHNLYTHAHNCFRLAKMILVL